MKDLGFKVKILTMSVLIKEHNKQEKHNVDTMLPIIMLKITSSLSGAGVCWGGRNSLNFLKNGNEPY